MNIGDLFLNIAIKGGEAAVKTLTGVKEGLGTIASSSLAAKAGVLAVLYGLERMTSAASENGLAIHNFGVLTGQSTDNLQKWQYAAMKSGQSAEDMMGTITGLQGAMAEMALHGGGPAGGMGIIGDHTGGIDPVRALEDTDYLMKKLQQFAQATDMTDAYKNSFLSKMGITQAGIITLKEFKGNVDDISNSKILSKGEVDQLSKVNRAWADLWYTMKLYGTKKISFLGFEGVKTVGNSFKFLTNVIENVIKLKTEFPLLVKTIIAGIAIVAACFNPWRAFFTGLILLFSEIQNYRDGKETPVFNAAVQYGKDIGNTIGNGAKSLYDSIVGTQPTYLGPERNPAIPIQSNNKSTPSGDVFNLNVKHIGDAKDTKAVGDLHLTGMKGAVKHAWVNSPAHKEGG